MNGDSSPTILAVLFLLHGLLLVVLPKAVRAQMSNIPGGTPLRVEGRDRMRSPPCLHWVRTIQHRNH